MDGGWYLVVEKYLYTRRIVRWLMALIGLSEGTVGKRSFRNKGRCTLRNITIPGLVDNEKVPYSGNPFPDPHSML